MNQPNADTTGFYWPNGEPYVSPAAAERRAQKEQAEAALAATLPVVKDLEGWLAAGGNLAVASTEAGVALQDLRRLLKRMPAHSDWWPGCIWSAKDQAETARKVEAWLLANAEGDKTRLQHADTQTTAFIGGLIDEARESHRLSVIIGAVGIGKSFTSRLKAASMPRTASTPGVVHIEHREHHRSINQFLLHLWQRLSFAPDQEPRGDIQGAILGLLRKGDVVVIDECNRLSQCGSGRVTEAIRDLFDNAPASWVLMGNREATKSVQILDAKLYGAFLSRARLYHFDFTSEADISAFMEWKGLEGEGLRRQLVRTFAGSLNSTPRRDGSMLRNVGLRGLNMALEDAVAAAKEQGLSSSEALRRHLAQQLALAQG